MEFIGYIAVLIAVSTFVFVGLMVLVGLIKGFIHHANSVEIEDPLENDPDVFSGKTPGLAKGEMNPFESTSVKRSLPFLIAAICVMVIILGFSAYGLKEMAGSTGTTAAMRQEAKEKAERQEEKYGSGPAIEEAPEEPKKKKQLTAEDLAK